MKLIDYQNDSETLKIFFMGICIKKIKLKKNTLPSTSEPYVNIPGILDHLGGSFKQYILENDMNTKIKNLKENLDKKSCDLIDRLLFRIIHLPDHEEMSNILFTKRSLLDNKIKTNQEQLKEKEYWNSLEEYQRKYNLLGDVYNPDTFLYHHGLIEISNKAKEYIKGKDFIDGGSYIGDSALVLLNYEPKLVHSFELSKSTSEKFKQIMNSNNIPADKYRIINKGLSNNNSEVYFNDSASQGTSVKIKGRSKAFLTSIDSYRYKNQLTIGFIKSDVEGYGLEVLDGMTETIKKDRPILSLSIYHNPHEFFELKPRLEQITKDLRYHIEIKHLHPLVDCMVEVVAFATPKELI